MQQKTCENKGGKNRAGAKKMAFSISLLAMLITSCHKKGSDEESSFLGSAKSGIAGALGIGDINLKDATDEEKATSASDSSAKKAVKSPQESRGVESLESKDKMVITAAEWEEMRSDARNCHASAEAFKSEAESEKKAAYAKGQSDCRVASEREKNEFAEKFVDEAQKLLLEARDKLARYALSSALINGECEAVTNTGDRVNYVLENVCVNVVNKKVGNDGEVAGLLGAVSTEAMKRGIVSLDCDIGRAHIALMSKKCEKALGTGAGAGRIEEKASAAGKVAPRTAIRPAGGSTAPATTGGASGTTAASAATPEVTPASATLTPATAAKTP